MQAVLNTFACFHIDTGSGDYSGLQRVRLSMSPCESKRCTMPRKTFVVLCEIQAQNWRCYNSSVLLKTHAVA